MEHYDLDNFDIFYGDETSVINVQPFSILPSTNWNGQNINVCQITPQHHEAVFTADFNGDRKSDILAIFEGNVNYYNTHFPFIYENAINIFPVLNINFAQLNTHDFKTEIIDFDGDGKSDIMIMDNQAYYVYKFIKNVSGTYYDAVQIGSGGYPTAWHTVYPADFNGDGKTDLLTNTGDGLLWEIATCTGKIFTATTFGFNKQPIPQVGTAQYDRLLLADYNGDGKTDILQIYDDFPNPLDHVHLYYSKGNSFLFKSFSGTDLVGMLSPIDANGDGRLEVISKPSIFSDPSFLYFRKDGKENLLEKIMDGLKRETIFSYNKLTSGNPFYTKGMPSVYPLLTIQPPINVLSSFTLPDGIGGQNITSFAYEQALMHQHGKGFLGFKKIISENNISHIKSESINEINTLYYLLYPLETNTYLTTNSSQLSHSSITNAFVATTSGGFYQKLLTQTSQDFFTNTTTTITNNNFDAYGNVLSSTTNINGIENIVTNTQYTMANTPVPARPVYSSTTKTRTGAAPVNEKISLAYDAKGRLIQRINNFQKPQTTTTTYQYDDYGNIINEAVAGTAIPYTASTSAQYDSKGRFPISNTNVLNQISSSTWHPVWGKPLTTTGIDGLTTTNTYDTWGKCTSTTMPEGYTINYYDAWDINNGAYWFSYVMHPGKPDVQTWYDILGRAIRTKTKHPNNQWAESSTTYNATGKIASLVAPHLPNEPLFTTTTSYDAYQRISATTNNFGTTSYAYSFPNNNSKVTVTNPAGQSSSSTTDVSGKVVETEDNGGKLTYLYDSRGNNTLVKHASKILSQTSYDNYGRKTSMWDMDAGTTEYTYDAWGRLLTEKDANNNTQTFSYDVTNRVTSRIAPEGTTTYQYYGAGQGFSNQLSDVYGFNGINEHYDYNNLGYLIINKKTIAGTTYEEYYDYNTYGNLIQKTYSSGFGLVYEYDINGYLNTVKPLSGTGSAFFTAGSRNAQGQYTSYTLGNGHTTANTYYYGYLTHTATAGIQDMSLTYDYTNSNLLVRQDNIKNLREDFQYDNLNRLTSSTVYNLTAQTVLPTISTSYDLFSGSQSLGNIKTKTDVGDYGYSKHAVLSVTNPAGLISQQNQDISYTPFRKTEEVTENGFTQHFTYDASYSRIRTDLSSNGSPILSRLYLGDYEITIDPVTGNKKYVHYISGGDGLCTMVVFDNSYNAATASTHYIYKDHLGSLVTATDASGTIEAEQNFDAWGRARNPQDWSYNSLTMPPSWLYRGYTGHEHMPHFTLINMNARMYDPILGRMLAPDNYIMGGTQGYNRYTYALNNPLKFTDPSGNWVQFVAGAILGGFSGWQIGKAKGAKDWNMVGYIVGGAVIGAASAGAGTAVSSAGGGAILAGATSGAVGGAGFSGLATNWNGNAMLDGAWKGALTGVAGSTVGSAIGGGWGAFAGGATAGGLGTLLNGGSIEESFTASVIGGVLGVGVYYASIYTTYKSSKIIKSNFKFKEFDKIVSGTQKSLFWNREYQLIVNRDGSYAYSGLGRESSTVGLGESYYKNAKYSYHSHPGGANFDGMSTFNDIIGTNNLSVTETDQFARVQLDNLAFTGKTQDVYMFMGSSIGNFYFMPPNSSNGNYYQINCNFNNIFNYYNLFSVLPIRLNSTNKCNAVN